MSLRTRVILLLLIFLAATFGMESTILVSNSLRHAEQQVRLSGLHALTRLTSALREPGRKADQTTYETVLRAEAAALREDLPFAVRGGLVYSLTLPTASGSTIEIRSEQTFVEGRHAVFRESVLLEDPLDGFSGMPSRAELTVGVPLPELNDLLVLVYQQILLIGGSVLLLGVLLFAMLNNSYLAPVLALRRATERVAEGDFGVNLDVRTGDELQELAQSFRQMVERLDELQALALDANPLTGLPGNATIHQRLQTALQDNGDWVVIYADLDNFKAYNDTYGFERGDRIIIHAADVFERCVEQKAAGSFLGHIGGDDFVILTPRDQAETLAREIAETFDRTIATYYDPEDARRGCIRSRDRQGNEQTFPLVGISLACIDLQRRDFARVPELAAAAAELKKFAKRDKTSGSNYLFDRRGNGISDRIAKVSQGPESAGSAPDA